LTLKKHIPNSLTLLNLLFGCIAVLCFFLDYVVYIPFLTALSLLADFLDGLAARALNVSSPIGKELDSLADAVSFGVVPAIALVYLITYYTYPPSVDLEFNFAETLNRIDSISEGFLILFPLILALFSVLRLAKFNISTDQTSEFKGLATPASTIFVMGLFIAHFKGIKLNSSIDLGWMLRLIAIILSGLLLSNIPMFSFKLKGFALKENKWQYIFIAISLILVAGFQWASIPLIIICYILLNIARTFEKRS